MTNSLLYAFSEVTAIRGRYENFYFGTTVLLVLYDFSQTCYCTHSLAGKALAEFYHNKSDFQKQRLSSVFTETCSTNTSTKEITDTSDKNRCSSIMDSIR